jgi:hypothetical protein
MGLPLEAMSKIFNMAVTAHPCATMIRSAEGVTRRITFWRKMARRAGIVHRGGPVMPKHNRRLYAAPERAIGRPLFWREAKERNGRRIRLMLGIEDEMFEC